MRTALLALALLTVAGCDSVGPTDPEALVGTWSLRSFDEELRVTSTVDQSLPDFSGPGQGAVTATGAESAQFRYVVSVFGSGTEQSLTLTDRDPLTTDDGYAELSLYRSGTGSESGSYGFLYGRSGAGYSATGPVVPFTQSGGQIAVPSLTLSDGAQTVSVGGTLTFPTVSLTANTPASLPQRSFGDDQLGDDVTFAFFEDGTFETSFREGNRTETMSGTWESDEDGEVRVGVREGNVTTTVRFSFEVRDGALRLETTDSDFGGGGSCNVQCRRSYEGSTLARGGSFSAVELAVVYRFDEGPSSSRARAQTAESSDAARPARRRGVPLFGSVR